MDTSKPNDVKTEYSFKPRRMLGRTCFRATLLGIGDLADRNIALDICVETVRRALDAGLNVIDTAPGYEDGYSEEIVGRAIKGRREGIFVIDKIDHPDQPVAQQIDGSLRRLQMDMVDLFVIHGLSTIAGWEQAIMHDGVFDQLEKCRADGKLRFRGISSHNPEMLELAIRSNLCDVVMFAVGPYCDRRYYENILPLARQHNVGTVCFKTFGAGKLLGDTTGYGKALERRPRGKFSSGGHEQKGVNFLPHLTVCECVHHTLTCDPDVTLLGLSFPNEQDAAFSAAVNFKPLSLQQLTDIRNRATLAVQGKGPCWWDPP